MAVLILERLPAGTTGTSAVLLQAAISPRYNLSAALAGAESESGVSPLRNLFFLGIFTTVAGTIDGRHTPAAGMVGFRPPAGLSAADKELYATRLHEVSFRPAMSAAFHLGGHFGPTNRVFVGEWIAPFIRKDS